MTLSRPGFSSHQLLVERIFLNAKSYPPQISYSYLTIMESQKLRTRLYEYSVLRRIFGRNRHGATGGGRKLNTEQAASICSFFIK
jgi:hypothetical protein